jgi:uncharacterized protein YggL (DUF469 family)
MPATSPSTNSIRRLNRRQRKKLHVGEFKAWVFHVRIHFKQALDVAAYAIFIEAFIVWIETQKLSVGGFGGCLPILETEGIIDTARRGSPTEQDRLAVAAWLNNCPEVASVNLGELVDGWYGWNLDESA